MGWRSTRRCSSSISGRRPFTASRQARCAIWTGRWRAPSSPRTERSKALRHSRADSLAAPMAEQPSAVLAARARAGRALRRPPNWMQLAKFGAVGATGYIVNLVVYPALLRGADWHYASAATASFLVAVTNNYLWNRLWTFRDQRGHVGFQGLRFFAVALVAYGANLGILSALIAFGMNKVAAQAGAMVLVAPLNFIGNKLWSFAR